MYIMHVYACVRACVRVCVCACVHVCAHVCVCVCAHVCVCVRVCMWCVCVWQRVIVEYCVGSRIWDCAVEYSKPYVIRHVTCEEQRLAT